MYSHFTFVYASHGRNPNTRSDVSISRGAAGSGRGSMRVSAAARHQPELQHGGVRAAVGAWRVGTLLAALRRRRDAI